MAERNQEFTANKRALARSLERERALRDELEELQIAVSRLEDDNATLSRDTEAISAAASGSVFSIFAHPTHAEPGSARASATAVSPVAAPRKVSPAVQAFVDDDVPSVGTPESAPSPLA